MQPLPPIIGPDPAILFCGSAGEESPTSREHYYQTPGNSFWESVHLAGLSPVLLDPTEDHRLPSLGLGVTDVVGRRVAGSEVFRADVEELLVTLERWQPDWLAFTGKTVAAQAARALGRRPPRLLGATEWYLGTTQVFVLPGPSGANRRRDYDGRPTRLAWWRELAQLAGLAGPDGTFQGR